MYRMYRMYRFLRGMEGAERHPLVCEHCGAPEQPGNPVQRCAVDGLTYLPPPPLNHLNPPLII